MKNKYPRSFKGVRCDIVGMGISNVALAEYLHKEGALLTVRDKIAPTPLTQERLKRLSEYQIYGDNYLSDLTGEFIFRAPSIRPDHTQLTSAISNGSILGAEWELFFHRAPCDVFAVTGSDGKTTTVTLSEKMLSLSQPQKRIISAGNIGVPLISLVDKLTINDLVVAELSSFQLMTFDCSPKVSAITNVSPNHLDYHANMQEYTRSKQNIISPQTQRVIIHPDRIPEDMTSKIKKENINVISCGFSKSYELYCRNNQIYDHNIAVLNTDKIKLKGKHNVENYMTAIGIGGALLSIDAISEIAETFSGVEHRMQLISEKNGVSFYDSSIDSTPSRTIATLQSLSDPLTVICGGYDKNLTYELLADALNKYAYAVVVTGSSAEKILEEIYRLPHRNFILYHIDDFEEAVTKATSITPHGGSVVLSPACASFDRFKDYKERGRIFAEIVRKLP